MSTCPLAMKAALATVSAPPPYLDPDKYVPSPAQIQYWKASNPTAERKGADEDALRMEIAGLMMLLKDPACPPSQKHVITALSTVPNFSLSRSAEYFGRQALDFLPSEPISLQAYLDNKIELSGSFKFPTETNRIFLFLKWPGLHYSNYECLKRTVYTDREGRVAHVNLFNATFSMIHQVSKLFHERKVTLSSEFANYKMSKSHLVSSSLVVVKWVNIDSHCWTPKFEFRAGPTQRGGPLLKCTNIPV